MGKFWPFSISNVWMKETYPITPITTVSIAITRKNHQVVRCRKENVNFSNLLVIWFCSIVKGIMPQAWQRLTNGLSCSKTDIFVCDKILSVLVRGNLKEEWGKCIACWCHFCRVRVTMEIWQVCIIKEYSNNFNMKRNGRYFIYQILNPLDWLKSHH